MQCKMNVDHILFQNSGVLAHNIRNTKAILNALTKNGGERLEGCKIKCPCCEKLICMNSNGSIKNLKQHLRQTKGPTAQRLLETATAIEVFLSFCKLFSINLSISPNSLLPSSISFEAWECAVNCAHPKQCQFQC